MKKMYNHGYEMGFSVLSDSPDGVTVDDLIRGLERRIAMLKANEDELKQAVEPFDAAFEPLDEKEVEEWMASCPRPTRVLIVMDGGLIQYIQADPSDLQVVIADHDIDGVDPDERPIFEGPEGECIVIDNMVHTVFEPIDWWPFPVCRIVPAVISSGPDGVKHDATFLVDAQTGRVVEGPFFDHTALEDYIAHTGTIKLETKQTIKKTAMRDEINEMLLDMYRGMSIDRPANHSMILDFVEEDVRAAADPENWHSGDVAIAFRRWMEQHHESN